jgi:hypothetical protein
MGPPIPERSEKQLENLRRLLSIAQKDRSLLLAEEFLGEAQASFRAGDRSTASRSIAAAEIALRVGGHGEDAPIARELTNEPSPAPPLSIDPPAPPAPTPSRQLF